MEIRLRPGGCAEKLAAVFSFGLSVLVLRSYRRQLPARLTDDSMLLRDGREIPWNRFTRIQATDVYYRRVFIGTRYQLWYQGGKNEFATNKIEDSQAVVAFVIAHLPPGVVNPPK